MAHKGSVNLEGSIFPTESRGNRLSLLSHYLSNQNFLAQPHVLTIAFQTPLTDGPISSQPYFLFFRVMLDRPLSALFIFPSSRFTVTVLYLLYKADSTFIFPTSLFLYFSRLQINLSPFPSVISTIAYAPFCLVLRHSIAKVFHFL